MDKKIENKDCAMLLCQALTEAPLQFSFDGCKEKINLYQPTIGHRLLIDQLKGDLGIDEAKMSENPMLELLRICKTSRDTVIKLIAYNTIKGSDINKYDLLTEREKLLKRYLNIEDMASLLYHVLHDSDETISKLIKQYGIDKEMSKRERIMRIKGHSNQITLGGKSMYGTLISVACKDFGWDMNYIIWGISYVNLMMMYLDRSETLYLSDEEMKRVPKLFIDNGTIIRADDPKNMDIIRQMDWR